MSAAVALAKEKVNDPTTMSHIPVAMFGSILRCPECPNNEECSACGGTRHARPPEPKYPRAHIL